MHLRSPERAQSQQHFREPRRRSETVKAFNWIEERQKAGRRKKEEGSKICMHVWGTSGIAQEERETRCEIKAGIPWMFIVL